MANFYVSSVAYAAIAPWAATTAYTVGQIIRPTAAVAGKKVAYRCTTPGTSAGSEPTWGTALGGTTTSGGAVFTAINSDTYGWSAAAGDAQTVTNAVTSGFATAGDTIFLSSDHSETTAATPFLLASIGGSWTSVTTSILSVNRAGSVPPVAADLTSGASITYVAVWIDSSKPVYINGVTFVASAGNVTFGNTNGAPLYLKNCSLQIVSGTYKITTGESVVVTLDNTSMSFSAIGQGISIAYPLNLTWINTAVPLLGTAPTSLFAVASSSANSGSVVCRGVDFSSYTGTFLAVSSGYVAGIILLDSCKVSASATFISGTPYSDLPLVELVNCWDGTNVLNSRYTTGGSITTERTITLTGGAADDIGSFSLKMVSGSARIDKWVAPIASFWIDVENISVGSSKTATVEIVSSVSLYNDEIWLQLEYMGASGTPLSTIVTSQPATILTTHAAVPTSSASWNSSPATPVYQHLQVTFTPQRAGRVRGRVMLGKASTTVYVDPNIVIT